MQVIKTTSTTEGILILLWHCLLVVFVPLCIIFSLNTLFPVLAIPYDFWTWLSVVVLNLTWMFKPKLQSNN